MMIQELKAPFEAKDIEWRVQRSGVKDGKAWAMVLAYVTNRAIMDRLDAVCGIEGWRNEYKPIEKGMLCGISIKINDEWITKWDGAQNTDIEPIKGGISGSMKRAAVQWGIGRYLYGLSATFANVNGKGSHSDKAKDKQTNKDVWFKWDPPPLPEWALPEQSKEAAMTSDQYDTICKLSERLDEKQRKALQKRLQGAVTKAKANEMIQKLEAMPAMNGNQVAKDAYG